MLTLLWNCGKIINIEDVEVLIIKKVTTYKGLEYKVRKCIKNKRPINRLKRTSNVPIGIGKTFLLIKISKELSINDIDNVIVVGTQNNKRNIVHQFKFNNVITINDLQHGTKYRNYRLLVDETANYREIDEYFYYNIYCGYIADYKIKTLPKNNTTYPKSKQEINSLTYKYNNKSFNDISYLYCYMETKKLFDTLVGDDRNYFSE